MYSQDTFANLKVLYPSLNGKLFEKCHAYRKQVLNIVAHQEKVLNEINSSFDQTTQTAEKKLD